MSLRLRACAPEREQRRQRPWSVGAVDSTRHTRRHTRKTKARTGVFRLVRFLSLSLSLSLLLFTRLVGILSIHHRVLGLGLVFRRDRKVEKSGNERREIRAREAERQRENEEKREKEENDR
mgnify:CR=1 FL=1